MIIRPLKPSFSGVVQIQTTFPSHSQYGDKHESLFQGPTDELWPCDQGTPSQSLGSNFVKRSTYLRTETIYQMALAQCLAHYTFLKHNTQLLTQWYPVNGASGISWSFLFPNQETYFLKN